MSTILDYNGAHEFVDEQASRGAKIRWDGWDIVIFYPNDRAWGSPAGIYHNQWGFERRFSPGDDGNWRIARNHVRDSRRTRS